MIRRVLRNAACLLLGMALLVQGVAAADNTDGDKTTTKYMDNNTVQQDAAGMHESDVLIDGDRLVCQNDHLQMYYNEETSILKVCDLTNHYIWASGKADDTTAVMTASWEKFSHCLVSAEFIDTSTMTTLTAMPNFKKQQSQYLENGILITVPFSKVDCSVSIQITLDEDAITVDVPDDRIEINEEKKLLSKLYVLPFFGASIAGGGDGYLLIPDGCGALIRFGASLPGTGSYVGRIYGNDRSINAVGDTALVSGGSLSGKEAELPVFGIVHGNEQNAVLYEIRGGAEYCNIVASPAGNVIDWFWAAPQFIYSECYYQQDNAGSGFILAQDERNEVNASFQIHFFSGDDADYVGMGTYYRETLQADGRLGAQEAGKDTIPLMLDCLMAESENTGVFTRGVVLTKLADLERWNNELAANGIDNIVFSLRGTAKGGYSRSKAEDYGVWHKIGTEKEAAALVSQGLQLIFNKDMLRLFPGQMSRNNYVYAIDRAFAKETYLGYLDDVVYYADMRAAAKISSDAEKNTLCGLSVSSLAEILESNYKSGDSYNRSYAVSEIVQILSQLRKTQDYISLQSPNVYAWPYMDAAYDVPVNNSSYLFETDEVPFMQIVLGGTVDLFSDANQVIREEDRAGILRLIDYDVYPQFTVTEKSEAALAKTNSNMVSSSRFDMLSGELQQIYKEVDRVLAPVSGATVTERKVPRDDFVITDYSNGWSVVINYSNVVQNENGISVPAASAVAVETRLLSTDGRG